MKTRHEPQKADLSLRHHIQMKAPYIALLVMASVTGHASDWIAFPENAQSTSVATYLDASSLKPEGQEMRGWFKMVFSSPQKSENGKVLYTTSVILTLIDCNQKYIATEQWVYYDAAGAVVQSGRTPWLQRQAIVPDSTGDLMHKYACNIKLLKRPAAE